MEKNRKMKCKDNIKLDTEVFDFIKHVEDVGEESITDYLVWQWRKRDKRFNYLNVEKHNRIKENKVSGADFELELWILTKKESISFVFQAKKIIPNRNAYCSKLNYQNGPKRQIDKLIDFAKKKNKLPFYIFYSPADNKSRAKCNRFQLSNSALFMTDAYTVDQLTVNYKRKKLSKNQILNETNPFHCLFCCPLVNESYYHYLESYFERLIENHSFEENNEIPRYVNAIANNEVGITSELINEHGLTVFRNIGVLDLRNR